MAQTECSMAAPATSIINVDDHCRRVKFLKFDAAQKPPSDPAQRKHYVCHGPIQPRLNKFTVTNGRSFNKLSYDKYSWLEYSIEKNAAFCFYCRLFGSTINSSRSSTTYTVSGFSDWS